ncbi:MAG: N-6 DNA methylase [bacterium]
MEPGAFTEEIKAEYQIIYSVIELLQGVSLARTELDIKGEAFEHFLGGVFREAMGQYFTPRPIVKFMVHMLEPNESDKVIDPACGSGGFLLYVLDKVKKYLEETLTPNDAKDRWKDFALYQLFGIEINSQLARVSMMNMIIHEDGHSNIENNDALDDTSKFHPRRDIRLGKYSLLLTNPPFGAVIKIREHDYLKEYELGTKEKPRNRQNTEILFIERCVDYLKPGGRMGIVLPDGILTNSSNQYVRDFITRRAQILAVVSLPQTAFRRPHAKGGGGTGSGVKASLVFLRKKKEGEQLPDNYPVFMAIAEHIGYDSTGRPDKNEFSEIVEAYKKFEKKRGIDFFLKAPPLSFGVGQDELQERLDPFYHKPEFKDILHTSYNTARLLDILQIVESGSRPKGGVRTIESGIPSLGGEHLNSDGGFDFSNIRFVSEDYYKKQTKGKVTYNDILIVKDGATTGKVAIVRENFPYKDCLINEHLFLKTQIRV